MFNQKRDNINLLYCPFSECRIMQFGYSTFFVNNPSIQIAINLEADEIVEYEQPNSQRERQPYWVALKPTDNWYIIFQKTHDLLKMVDCCHFMLEGFSVMQDILVPEFGH